MMFIALALVLFGAMIFGFISLARKRAPKEFPRHWHEILLKNVRFYQNLELHDQMVFQRRMMAFLAEINIEAVQFKLEEIDEIFVAASAVIPVFGFQDWRYNNLRTVLLYPNHFNEDLGFGNSDKAKNIGGMVGTGQFEGQMILSRKALHHGFQNKTDKGNTGIHEFVHLLDKVDGATDGIPEGLLTHQYIAPWLKLMHLEMEAINNDTSDIRNYGGTKQAEFFAVAAEYFFERPKLFEKKHPELYDMLVKCFQQPKA